MRALLFLTILFFEKTTAAVRPDGSSRPQLVENERFAPNPGLPEIDRDAAANLAFWIGAAAFLTVVPVVLFSSTAGSVLYFAVVFAAIALGIFAQRKGARKRRAARWGLGLAFGSILELVIAPSIWAKYR